FFADWGRFSQIVFCLVRRREVFFYPQISQILADYGVVSCRCAAIHAAGFFADWGRFSQIVFCLMRRREGFLSADFRLFHRYFYSAV
ncbi:MAG: hypothetical protein ACOX9E_15505, partial [Lentisphaeria bacterium]